MQIADVYINIPVKSIAQAFSYRVPESLEKLSAGWRVLVPFAGRDIEGFIVCVYPAEKRQEHGCSYPVEKLKYIKAAVDDEPWFSPLMIEASRGSSFSIDLQSTDLPLPDSPASTSTSPFFSDRETP